MAETRERTGQQYLPWVKPWLAWSRTGPSHRSVTRQSVDHGTQDGNFTLCGIECGGDERSVPFNPDSALSCQRCVRRALSAPAGATTDLDAAGAAEEG